MFSPWSSIGGPLLLLMSLSWDMGYRFTMSLVLTMAVPKFVRKVNIYRRKLLISCLDQCTLEPGIARIMRHSVAQTMLDLLGDFFSKYTRSKDEEL